MIRRTNFRRDHFDLIVQADGDGGDTAQREGMFAAGLYLAKRGDWGAKLTGAFAIDHAIRVLQIRPGICVRHPHQPGFRSDPKHFSRDQHDPLIIAAGLHRALMFVRDSLWNQVKRWGRYQNRDFTNPNTVSVYIRAFRAWLLWPLMLITDWGLVVSSINRIVKARNPDESDDNNHVARLAQAQEILPTPISWIARKIYKKFRPHSCGSDREARLQWARVHGVRIEDLPELETDAALGAFAWYHRAQNGGNPAMVELWRPIIGRF